MEQMEEGDISSRFGASTKSQTVIRSPSGGLNTSNKTLWAVVVGAVLFGFIAMVSLATVANRISNIEAYPNVCMEKDCLWEASEILSNMNASADPCEDFYAYACGNFKNSHPAERAYDELTQFKLLQSRNDDRVLDIMKAPVKDASDKLFFESKLKLFYQSCQNDFLITNTGAKPVIAAMQPGWYPLMTAPVNATLSSLSPILQRLHADFGIEPFFKFDVTKDVDAKASPSDPDKYILQIYFGELEMSYIHFFYNSYDDYSYWFAGDDGSTADTYKDAFIQYVKNVVTLVQNDNGVQLANPEKLAATTAEDVWYIESELAKIHNEYWTSFTLDVPSDQKIQTVKWMEDNMKGKIQWKSILSATFKDAGITDSTPVHLHLRNALNAIITFISKLNDRQLNNYLMWKMVSGYLDEMGWKYVHERRQFTKAVEYYTSFTKASSEDRCLEQAKQLMRTAVDALYIETHHGLKSNDKVKEINDLVKQSMIERVDSISWMDADTKKAAKKKLSSTTDLFGYPDWLANRQAVNQFYNTLTIEQDKHFQNVLNLRQFRNSRLAILIRANAEQDRWPQTIQSTTYAYDAGRNRLYYPAGLLQHPVFDVDVPQYVNFAGLGAILGSELISVFDYETGRNYDETGRSVKLPWWSVETKNNYEAVANVSDCHSSIFTEISAFRRRSAGNVHMREVAGLETAFNAYARHVAKYGNDKILLGLQAETVKQQFFVAYAQLYCFSGSNRDYFISSARPVGPVMLNRVVEHSPDFAMSFNCKAESRLGATASKKAFCPGY